MEREDIHCLISGLVGSDRVRIHFSETVVSHFDMSGDTLARMLQRIDPGLPASSTDVDIMSDPALCRRIMDEASATSHRDLDAHDVLITGMGVFR